MKKILFYSYQTLEVGGETPYIDTFIEGFHSYTLVSSRGKPPNELTSQLQ